MLHPARLWVPLASCLLAGSAAAEPLADSFVAHVARVEARTSRLLRQLGRATEPLARRCLTEQLALSRRCLRDARAARRRLHGPSRARQAATVALTRAFLQSVILDHEARRCAQLIGLTAGPPRRTRTGVTVEVDPGIPAGDSFE